MVNDNARDRAIYQALKAADEVAAALQTHLLEEHGAGLESAREGAGVNSLRLLRQARERLGAGLRSVEADQIAESDAISLRNKSLPIRVHGAPCGSRKPQAARGGRKLTSRQQASSRPTRSARVGLPCCAGTTWRAHAGA